MSARQNDTITPSSCDFGGSIIEQPELEQSASVGQSTASPRRLRTSYAQGNFWIQHALCFIFDFGRLCANIDHILIRYNLCRRIRLEIEKVPHTSALVGCRLTLRVCAGRPCTCKEPTHARGTWHRE